MVGKDIRFGHDAKKAILEGIIAAADAITSTLGPKGTTVMVDKGNGHPYYTKDGKSISEEIKFRNYWKNLGAVLVRNTSRDSNKEAGDGSTTVSLLFSELAKEGAALIDKGIDQIDIARGYRKASEDILEKIQKYKRVVKSDTDILNIATISANNDSVIGNTILEAFQGIGEDGVVSVKDSFNGKTEITFSEGYKVPQGMLSGDYVTDRDNEIVEFKNGAIVIYGDAITDYSQIKSLLTWMTENNKPVILFANSISSAIETQLCSLNKQKVIQICPIKASDKTRAEKLERYKDIAAYFGIAILGTDDRPIDSFDASDCIGLYKSVQVTPQMTIFTDPVSNETTLNARVAELKTLLTDATTAELSLAESEKEGLQERIANLTGGIATIYVGGVDEADIREKRDRYEDALNAVRAAVTNGIVPGGGVTLLKAAYDCDKIKYPKETPDFMAGYKTFLRVCRKPVKHILKNLMNPEEVELTAAKIAANKSLISGYNAKTNKFVKDMFKEGVIDPIKVEQCALRYSTNSAALFLTSDAVIVDEQHDNIDLSPTDPIMEKYS